MLKRLIVFGFILLWIFLSGCTAVRPWHRESLSDPIMIMDENPVDAGIRQHYLDYREGSVGATGEQSGGCGCG
jgi:hypothetical protein